MKKEIILATLGYTIGTFALAVIWHILLFETQYISFKYFEVEPNFALGLVTILIQGAILSAFYSYLTFKNRLPPFTYVLVLGGFFWTSHVLAFIAKQEINNAGLFILMESVYLFFQFGLYGFVLKWIYAKKDNAL